MLSMLVAALLLLAFADNLEARGKRKGANISDPAAMEALQGKLIDALTRSDKPPPIKARGNRVLQIANEADAAKPKQVARPVPPVPSDPLMSVVLAAMHRADDLPDLPAPEPDCDPVPLATSVGRAGMPSWPPRWAPLRSPPLR
ncbi:MAG: hypothetical protein R3E68_11680 [Burkholderiaceae bacterium]